ncbi:hypothetical protein chiPu_0022332 [Chiloscyllium punctatum]|uniref:Uncharacterized protein n=1 Tax=Chiloscyllium punctatum TaxID=137246 RepID=A0A401RIJ4_CHIPU|nr:hypothetical protein [Chiloscyllium punctatum]
MMTEHRETETEMETGTGMGTERGTGWGHSGSFGGALWERALPWFRAELGPGRWPPQGVPPDTHPPPGGSEGGDAPPTAGGEGGEHRQQPSRTPATRGKGSRVRRSPRVTKGVPPRRYGQPSARRTRGGGGAQEGRR